MILREFICIQSPIHYLQQHPATSTRTRLRIGKLDRAIWNCARRILCLFSNRSVVDHRMSWKRLLHNNLAPGGAGTAYPRLKMPKLHRLEVNGERVQWGPAPCDPRWTKADPIDRTYPQRDGQGIAEDGSRRTEDGGWKTEDGRQKTEDRGRRAEAGRRKTEGGGRRAEGSIGPLAKPGVAR
jgi:hypothetical protein